MSEIGDLKTFVESNNLEAIQNYVSALQNEEINRSVEWDYLFQKVYLHACLKKRREVADWIESVCFPQLPEIQQMAVRQVFSYGRYLLNKK